MSRRPCWSPTCPTTWPCRSCCTCSRCCRRSAGPGHGAGRGGRPDVRAARQQGLRRPVGQAGLVRDRAAGRSVSRTVFWPVPNVDSALVAFTRWPDPAAPARAMAAGGLAATEVFAVVDAAFAQRRKTLRAALAAWAGSAAGRRDGCCAQAGVDPSLRGEAIGVAAVHPDCSRGAAKRVRSSNRDARDTRQTGQRAPSPPGCLRR